MTNKEPWMAIWMAEIFDEKGYADISKVRGGPNPTYEPIVKIGSINEETGNLISGTWGGTKINNNKSTKNHGLRFFSWQEALVLLNDIFPFIKNKRERVKIMIDALTALEAEEKAHPGSIARTPIMSTILEPYFILLIPYASDLKHRSKRQPNWQVRLAELKKQFPPDDN